MPRVPTYDSLTVTPSTMPSVALQAADTPDVVGQQLKAAGQSAMITGDALAHASEEAARQANLVRVNDALNKAVEARLKLTYDPQEGFSALKGKDALERQDGKSLTQEYTEKYDASIAPIADSLSNDAQRALFAQQSTKLRTQFESYLGAHVSQEYHNYNLSVQAGTVKVGQDQLALSGGDPALVNQASGAIKAAVYEQGKLMGWSGQEVEARMVDALSPGHVAVIGSAVDAGNVAMAKDYVKQYGDQLTAQDRLRVDKLITTGDFEKRTQDAADEVWSKYRGNISGALAYVREKYSGKDEDGIVQRLKSYDSESEALKNRYQRDSADKAWSLLANGQPIPPSLMTQLDGKDAMAIRNAQNKPERTNSDPTAYYALSQMAQNNPDSFAGEDLRRYSDVLSPGDFKHFADIQSKSKSGEGADVTAWGSQKSQIADAINLKDKEQRGKFEIQADSALRAAMIEKGGKPLTSSERQHVLDQLVIKGKTPGVWFGSSSVRKWQADSQGKPFTPTWADDDVRKATAALVKMGVAKPTQQQIEQVLTRANGFN